MVLITLDNIANYVNSNNPIIELTPVTKTSPNIFRLIKPIQIELSDGSIFQLEKGWEFDGASVPWIFQPLFPKFGIYTYNALVHDLLYFIHYNDDRKFCDKEHFIWGKQLNISKLDNILRYKFLRMFAWYPWNNGKRKPTARLTRNVQLTTRIK